MLTMFTSTEAYTSERERQMTAKKGLFPTKVHICGILINIFCILAQLSKRRELEKLKSQLEAFKITSQMDNPPADSLRNITEHSLRNYIEMSLKAGIDVQTIKMHLRECERDLLISSQKLTWAVQEVDRIRISTKQSSSEYYTFNTTVALK